MTKIDSKQRSALRQLRKLAPYMSNQCYKTIKGQIAAGDLTGAAKGMDSAVLAQFGTKSSKV
jgi:hypothetical protein